MADPATPPANKGSDPNVPKRETLRISLPPRPLKPASTKITPRPNISAATTLPIHPTGQAGGASAPAWSTAVTKPIPNLSRPPSGSIPQLPPKLAPTSPLPNVPAKPTAPPLTGAPPSAKTTPLFPLKNPNSPSAIQGVVTPPPSEGRPITAVVPNPGVLAPQAPTAPAVSSGKMGVVPPRVIVANPQAKVYVQSGRIEVPLDIEPVPHNSKPPALPATQNLPKGFSSASSSGAVPSSAGNNGPTSSTRAPEPLTPQPPLIPPASSASAGVVESPGRPTTPDGKIAPVQIKKPTASLRLVDLPVTPGSRDVTQAMEAPPIPAAPASVPMSKTSPVAAVPTPVVSASPTPVAKVFPVAMPSPAAPASPMPVAKAPSVPTPSVLKPSPSTALPAPVVSKTASVPPPPPPMTRRLEPAPALPPRPTMVSPVPPPPTPAASALTAPVDSDKPPQKKKSSAIVPPPRASSPSGSLPGSLVSAPAPLTAAAVSPQDKSTIAPPRRSQAMPLAAAAVASAATPKVNVPTAVIPASSAPGAVKPIMPIMPGGKPGAILPVSPGKPGGITPVAPASGAVMPMKPAAASPAITPEGNKKSGTSVIKNAPPKETARITVKPSLLGASANAPRAGVGNLPTVKPAGGAVPVVAAATAVAAVGGVKAATTKPKTGVVSPASSAPKSAPAAAIKFQEEEEPGSTTVSTILAGVLALMTWGTAGILLASVWQ